MVITSESRKNKFPRYSSSQTFYAVIYVAVTFLVLVILNIYTSEINHRMVSHSKESAMLEKTLITAREIGKQDVLNSASVENSIEQMTALQENRVIVTNTSGLCLYDSENNLNGKYVLFPEILTALRNQDVFTLRFSDSATDSHAAVPIYTQGALSGAVYLTDRDEEQGILLSTMQSNILSVTFVLEILLILFSLIFSRTVSGRVKKLMSSLQRIQAGDYTQKVDISGKDELSFLGNEINLLTERLQTSEKKRNQFVSDASHELKTPLASIKLLSDSILQNQMEGEIMMEFVQDIGNEAERLNRMSQKLLTLTKSDSEAESDCELTGIAATIERVAKMLSVIASENNIHIHLDIRQDSTILIQEDDLYQVIFNLVENGIKYNVPGGVLTIILDRQCDNAVLSVIDTGMGIPEESLLHIFERFYRVDKARSRKSGGSGLGLAIVRNLIERNRGEITVSSTLGKGTTFTVSFPVFDMQEDSQ